MPNLFEKRKIFGYATAGGFSVSLDLVLLYFFTEIVGLYYILSAIIAFTCGTTASYAINRNLAFKGTKRNVYEGFAYFVCFHIIALIIIVSLLTFFVEFLNINYLISRILAGLIAGILDYTLNTEITFRK